MRKFAVPLSILVLVSLVLAACATPGAAPSPAVPTVSVPNTGTSVASETPAVASTATTTSSETPAATSAATATVGSETTTPAATNTVASGTETGTPTATSEAANGAATSTPAAGSATNTPSADLTGTPSASTQATPIGAAAFVQLSSLMNATVNASDNTQVGTVNGLLVDVPQSLVALAEGAATPTPVPSGTVTGRALPAIRYILVNTNSPAGSGQSGSGNEVLVPWQAFAFGGNGTASGTSQNPSTLTLKVGKDVFTGAPRTMLIDVSGGVGKWFDPVVPYWSGQNIGLPAAGSQNNNLVLLPSQISRVNIADQKNAVLGSASDVLVNTGTGELTFAVFQGGTSGNSRLMVVPFSNLIWNLGTGVNPGRGISSLQLNIPQTILNAAPFLNNLTLPLDPNLLNQLNQFWQKIQK